MQTKRSFLTTLAALIAAPFLRKKRISLAGLDPDNGTRLPIVARYNGKPPFDIEGVEARVNPAWVDAPIEEEIHYLGKAFHPDMIREEYARHGFEVVELDPIRFRLINGEYVRV